MNTAKTRPFCVVDDATLTEAQKREHEMQQFHTGSVLANGRFLAVEPKFRRIRESELEKKNVPPVPLVVNDDGETGADF